MSAGLERKAVEAESRVTSDLGEFAAIAATYDVDRAKDRIRFGAFEKTIARWQASGKRVPLHWEHRGEARNVIGSVDPATMREMAGVGLYVQGKLDLEDSEVAREAWRSMRDNRIALSFGYMTVRSAKRDGITDLLELDLFEVSLTPSPANPQTRILEMKSTAVDEREQRDLRRRSDQVALEAAMGWAPIPPTPAEPEREVKPVPTTAELRQRAAALGIRLAPTYLDAIRDQAEGDMLALFGAADAQAGKA
jgi:HK97 family phage prohead protease